MKRSQNWKNIFDWETGFMRPKKNGGWDKPFDPKEINNNFTEGNSWQYSFFVPQDIEGMIEAYGGNEKFEAKLDEMFNSESKTTGREQVDVTGLIGQYAHGNEPSHHMAYLYNYVGKPEKTKVKVHYILNEFYKNAPDGLIGNEDCGQMSAWYVLSSMGIYAVTPGKKEWETTIPFFKKSKIIFENKNQYKITRKKIKKIFSKKANNVILEKKDNLIPVPIIDSEKKSFKDEMKFKLLNPKPINFSIYDDLKMYCRIIDENYKNSPFFQYYGDGILIDRNTKVQAYSEINFNGKFYQSDTISATFFKKPNNYSIEIKSKYNPQYHTGGSEGLIDGIYGSENWRKGDWQGYQSQDFECVINMQSTREINSIISNFLQDTRSWILMPAKVEYYISNDNINFTLLETIDNTIDPKEYNTVLKGFQTTKAVKGQYVKIKAYNFGKLPEWHIGYLYNGEAFIFIDEIKIE